jgi:hypothetical protein
LSGLGACFPGKSLGAGTDQKYMGKPFHDLPGNRNRMEVPAESTNSASL